MLEQVALLLSELSHNLGTQRSLPLACDPGDGKALLARSRLFVGGLKGMLDSVSIVLSADEASGIGNSVAQIGGADALCL